MLECLLIPPKTALTVMIVLETITNLLSLFPQNNKSINIVVVSFAAVIRVVTQRFLVEEKRCVTTLITAVKETNIDRGSLALLVLGCTVRQLKHNSKTIQCIKSKNCHVIGDKYLGHFSKF